MSVNRYLQSFPADDDYSAPEQLLEKVRILTLSGQYERPGNILIALAPWVDGELTLRTTMSVEVFNAFKMQLLGCDHLKAVRDMFRLPVMI